MGIRPRSTLQPKQLMQQRVGTIKNRQSGFNNSIQDSEESMIYRGSAQVVAWKTDPYRSIRPKKVSESNDRTHAVLGITEISEPKIRTESIAKDDNKKNKSDQIKVRDIIHDLDSRLEVNQKEYNTKMNELTREFDDQEKRMEKEFKNYMKEERALMESKGIVPSEVELCKRVKERMKSKCASQTDAIFKNAAAEHMERCRAYSNRCNIALDKSKVFMQKAQVYSDDIVETNKYHFKMSENNQMMKNEQKSKSNAMDLAEAAPTPTID
jgi:hypothetical protein